MCAPTTVYLISVTEKQNICAAYQQVYFITVLQWQAVVFFCKISHIQRNLSLVDTMGPNFSLVVQRFSLLRGINVCTEVDLLGPKIFVFSSEVSLVQIILQERLYCAQILMFRDCLVMIVFEWKLGCMRYNYFCP